MESYINSHTDSYTCRRPLSAVMQMRRWLLSKVRFHNRKKYPSSSLIQQSRNIEDIATKNLAIPHNLDLRKRVFKFCPSESLIHNTDGQNASSVSKYIQYVQIIWSSACGCMIKCVYTFLELFIGAISHSYRRTQQPSLIFHPVGGHTFGLWPLFCSGTSLSARIATIFTDLSRSISRISNTCYRIGSLI
jgi:hypothetical protein